MLRLVRGPQAFRLALAPMTNDFVALLKDSSLVSVLTVMELTKQTQIFATNLGSWVIPGALCAALYLAMSLPLSALARRLERRWKAADRSERTSVISVVDMHLRRGSASGARRRRRSRSARGEVVALMGASGSGKTTILRAIAGLEPFERGTLDVDGVAVPAGPSRPRSPAASCGARSGWCSSSTACSSTCPRSRT